MHIRLVGSSTVAVPPEGVQRIDDDSLDRLIAKLMYNLSIISLFNSTSYSNYFNYFNFSIF